MKIIIPFLLLIFPVFASNIDNSYEALNRQIDALAPSLNTQERFSLYYLSLLTHDKLLAHKNIQSVKEKMLQEISKHQNTQGFEELKKSYMDLCAQKELTQKSVPYPLYIAIALSFAVIGYIVAALLFKKQQTRRADNEEPALTKEQQEQNLMLEQKLNNLQQQYDNHLAKTTRE